VACQKKKRAFVKDLQSSIEVRIRETELQATSGCHMQIDKGWPAPSSTRLYSVRLTKKHTYIMSIRTSTSSDDPQASQSATASGLQNSYQHCCSLTSSPCTNTRCGTQARQESNCSMHRGWQPVHEAFRRGGRSARSPLAVQEWCRYSARPCIRAFGRVSEMSVG